MRATEELRVVYTSNSLSTCMNGYGLHRRLNFLNCLIFAVEHSISIEFRLIFAVIHYLVLKFCLFPCMYHVPSMTYDVFPLYVVCVYAHRANHLYFNSLPF